MCSSADSLKQVRPDHMVCGQVEGLIYFPGNDDSCLFIQSIKVRILQLPAILFSDQLVGLTAFFLEGGSQHFVPVNDQLYGPLQDSEIDPARHSDHHWQMKLPRAAKLGRQTTGAPAKMKPEFAVVFPVLRVLPNFQAWTLRQ